jgi:hypothetical protein
MKGATEFHLDGLREENLPIPEPTTRARSAEVAVWELSPTIIPFQICSVAGPTSKIPVHLSCNSRSIILRHRILNIQTDLMG